MSVDVLSFLFLKSISHVQVVKSHLNAGANKCNDFYPKHGDFSQINGYRNMLPEYRKALSRRTPRAGIRPALTGCEPSRFSKREMCYVRRQAERTNPGLVGRNVCFDPFVRSASGLR
jgi:hypothetical protein